MNIIDFIKKELTFSGKIERFVFPLIIITVTIISSAGKDGFLPVFATICGITYTILAGKGRILCYFIGAAGTVCYSYLAFKSAMYANFALYALYYLPMDIIGIFKWKNHINRNTREVEKTKIPLKKHLLFIFSASVLSFITGIFLQKTGDISPFSDAFASIFSVYAMFLTVKRCIEQWDMWFIANSLFFIAWIKAYIIGKGSIAFMLMWLIYIILALYFKYTWEKEMKVT